MKDFSLKLKICIRFKGHYVSLDITYILLVILAGLGLGFMFSSAASADEIEIEQPSAISDAFGVRFEEDVIDCETSSWYFADTYFDAIDYDANYIDFAPVWDSVNDAYYMVSTENGSSNGLFICYDFSNYYSLFQSTGDLSGHLLIPFGATMMGYSANGVGSNTSNTDSFAFANAGCSYNDDCGSTWDDDNTPRCFTAFAFSGNATSLQSDLTKLSLRSGTLSNTFRYNVGDCVSAYGHQSNVVDTGFDATTEDSSYWSTWHNRLLDTPSGLLYKPSGVNASTYVWQYTNLSSYDKSFPVYDFDAYSVTSGDDTYYAYLRANITCCADSYVASIDVDLSWLSQHSWKLWVYIVYPDVNFQWLKMYGGDIKYVYNSSSSSSSASVSDYSDDIYNFLKNDVNSADSLYDVFTAINGSMLSSLTSYLTAGWSASSTYNGTITSDPNGSYNNTNFLAMIRCMELMMDEINTNVSDIEDYVSANGTISLHLQTMIEKFSDLIDDVESISTTIGSIASTNASILQYTSSSNAYISDIKSKLDTMQSQTHSDLLAIKNAIDSIETNVTIGSVTVTNTDTWSVNALPWITPILLDSSTFVDDNQGASDLYKNETQYLYETFPAVRYILYFSGMSVCLTILFFALRKK